MATYQRYLLSGSTNGKPIPISATATPGTLIHTAINTAGFDEVYLWASNVTSGAATLTIEWGGVTDPAHMMVKAYSIPANSPPMLIASGQVVNGGVVVAAFSGTASAINITGYINRIS